MYKKASKLGLRINTSKGPLSVEQLWTLSVSDLDTLAVSLEELVTISGKKSFLAKKSNEDTITKLKFDIVLDILTTKLDEAATAADAKAVKEHNKRILELMAKKKDESLEAMSLEDLEKLLK